MAIGPIYIEPWIPTVTRLTFSYRPDGMRRLRSVFFRRLCVQLATRARESSTWMEIRHFQTEPISFCGSVRVRRRSTLCRLQIVFIIQSNVDREILDVTNLGSLSIVLHRA